MLTISKNLVWPRDLESFKGGNFNTLSLVDCYVQICSKIMVLQLMPPTQNSSSLEMPVPSQGHYGFHSFPVVD
jgi:hypothetical protein